MGVMSRADLVYTKEYLKFPGLTKKLFRTKNFDVWLDFGVWFEFLLLAKGR